MAKKSGKKGKKSVRVGIGAPIVKHKKGKAKNYNTGVSDGKRPLAFLKSMLAKMEKNVPKLKKIIEQRGG